MDIIMHSYTFRGYPLEEAFVNARRFGWDGIELQPCHFDRDRIDTELPAAIGLGKRHGIPIRCVDFGGDFINDAPKLIEAEVRKAELEIEVCARNGIRLMNGGAGSLAVDPHDFGKNGSALAKDVHYERAAAAFKHLGALAAKHGIRLVFEIHMNCIHDTIAAAARLLDMIGLDNVMANPDPGNMYVTSTAEKNPDALDRLAGRIGYFHLKNCVVIGGDFDFSVKLADGHIDLYKWLAKLKALKFDGPLCIEYCGAGDPRPAAEQDIQYVRQCLDRLKS